MGQNKDRHPVREDFLAGGGEMGERVRAFDWASNPIGPIAEWPQSLRSALSICLNSGFPIALYWGEGLRLLYNDEWSPILGGKHPWALGRTARETWPEIWHIIEPLFTHVVSTGEATRSRDQLLPMHRHGFTEECYFDYTFTPIRGESGTVDGIFNAVLETTNRVIGERRLRTLRELAARTIAEADSAAEACSLAATVLAANPHDLPFAHIYLLDGNDIAKLQGVCSTDERTAASYPSIDLSIDNHPWPLREVMRTGKAVVVDDLSNKFGPLIGGAWPEPLTQAVVLPLANSGHSQLAGYLIAGVSPRLALGDEYRTFFDLVAGHIAAAIASARAHEEEKRRTEALAELDRAKTAFFSNVSHEFRTPLTLMLGPVEDLLARSHTDLPPAAAGQLEIVNRNGLRLLRLVNSLLDFSRIEAGRVQAVFQPTDLATFTADLASSFRSACERAGLRLVVDCSNVDEPVFVDREMWEKIVLNLISNAFKFTFEGSITVALERASNAVQLRVRDTGTGIPSEEMPKIFERFHRIENSQGRTHEGSGIGLALVQELVKLHRGTVAVESELGLGTTFIVTIPLGQSHLPAEQIGDSQRTFASGAAALPFVEEALRWLPEQPPGRIPSSSTPQNISGASQSIPDPNDDRPRVLVADDNADLRDYIARLLSEHFQVEVVPDGEAALAVARARLPDLVLTDAMMPRLDGFGLLKELRADARMSQLPIIILSARAGEESRVEGLEAGADDYLIKPFSARELVARVTAHIQMARVRRESERSVRESDERLRVTFASIGDAVLTTDSEGLITNMNPVAEVLTGWAADDAIGQSLETVFHIVNEATRLPVENPAARALRDGAIVGLANHTILIAKDGAERPIDDSAAPIRSKDGGLIGCVLVFRDVTERRAAEKALKDSELRYRLVGHAANDAIWDWDLVTNEVIWSEGVRRVFGYRAAEVGNDASWWFDNIHPEDLERIVKGIHEAIDGGADFWQDEYRYRRADDTYATVLDRGQIVRESGKPVRMVGSMLDLTERKRADAALKVAEDRFAFVRKSSGVGFWYCDLPFDVLQWDEQVKTHFHLPPDAHVTIDTFYDRIHTADREPTRAAIERSIADRTPYDVVYRTIDPAEGAEKWIRAIGRTFYADDGSPIRFDGVTLDVSDQKRAEVELRDLAAALSEAGHRKDEFLATLAHELRNPLAPLRNALELMRISNDPLMQAHARDMMERQLSQMVRLVDDLLDVSRITRGKVDLRKEHVPLSVVINSAVETSRPLVEQMSHKLEVTLPTNPIVVDADVTRLAQVFSNLLNNAAKYSERGGQISITAEQQDSEALVRVRDRGIGIATDQLPQIFEMFTQIDRSLEKSQGGLGIGLTLVKRLIEMHGGTVEAHSAGLGHGAEFIIRLSVVATVAKAPTIARPGIPQVNSSLRILIVDDNRDGADSLAKMLKIVGNDTRTAYDGEEGIEVAAEYRPDVILFDIGLPKLNGYEACRRIREQPWGKTTIIIAVTGWGQDEDKRKSQEAGFDYHLVKPVDPRALIHQLAAFTPPDRT